MTNLVFPAGFLWGAATSAQQIEGGVGQGGRGVSIWDRFAAEPGRIADGSTPEVACDHYHRWPEDVDLMGRMGLGAYRFSVAWPRVMPAGHGAVNAAGLDFYERLVDGLLEAGVQPFPTLNHWDLPVALQDAGGWPHRDTVGAFVDYALAVVDRLGDRVQHWATHNEPWCMAWLGHVEGHHAPGHRDVMEGLRAAHHLLLSHGIAADAIRELCPDARVGIVLMHVPAYPATGRPEDVDAARALDGFFNRWYLDPLFRGRYPEDVIADKVMAGDLPGPELPFVEQGDLARISAPLDWLGVNYYSRGLVRAGVDGRPEDAREIPPGDLTDMGWEVFPQGLEDSLLDLQRDYAPARLFVTENGAAWDIPADPDGRIHDQRRIEYLRGHFAAAHRAIERGVPLEGYFVWSLFDNFEWALGYEKKFGLYAIDPLDQTRIPKDSAHWYREVATTNAVSVDAVSAGEASRAIRT
jgi:beta-glucosidase